MISLLLRGMNYSQLRGQFNEELVKLYDKEESDSLFYFALDHVTGMKRNEVLLNASGEIQGTQLAGLTALLKQLSLGVPIQHIVGEAEFYGMKFRVNESVLIPRVETEELVDWIIKEEANLFRTENRNILDVGTGSGCIAISLKKHLTGSKVSALDMSPAAILVARQNAEQNGESTIDFIEADIRYFSCATKYNVVVSNPPYITQEEKMEMHENVLRYEPHIALFVDDQDPLLFYKAIADFSLSNLEAGGSLFFEINQAYGPETIDMLEQKGFKEVVLRKDMQGKDRMIWCRLPNSADGIG